MMIFDDLEEDLAMSIKKMKACTPCQRIEVFQNNVHQLEKMYNQLESCSFFEFTAKSMIRSEIKRLQQEIKKSYPQYILDTAIYG